MLSIKNVSKTYIDANKQRTILNNLSFTIPNAESLSIQGASGSGKSTLLHLLAGLDKPDCGEIKLELSASSSVLEITTFNETQADKYRRQTLGIIFQKFNLIDCISVEDNILLPARLNALNNKQYINDLIESLGIEKHLKKYPNQLSGGEQQRVAIARALSHQPALLLADEPTGNLDNDNANIVSQLLIDTCKKFKTTLIIVTHSNKVAALCNYQSFLKSGRIFMQDL